MFNNGWWRECTKWEYDNFVRELASSYQFVQVSDLGFDSKKEEKKPVKEDKRRQRKPYKRRERKD